MSTPGGEKCENVSQFCQGAQVLQMHVDRDIGRSVAGKITVWITEEWTAVTRFPVWLPFRLITRVLVSGPGQPICCRIPTIGCH